MKKHKQFTVMLLLVLASTWLAGCRQAYAFHGTVLDPPTPATEVTGTNWDGHPFHLHDLYGKVVVAFFGYTNCPDVCPLTLATMNEVYQKLGDQAQAVAFVFISTDPARDTPKRLATYIQAFNPHFYGINIPEHELVGVKKAYGVYAEKNKETSNQTADTYFVDHTSYIYLIDQQGQWRLIYPTDAPLADMVADIEQLLTE